MTVQHATAEVFYTAFKALDKEEQLSMLTLIARDKKLSRLLEDISDRQVIEEERNKPSRPLRHYVDARESREQTKVKAGK